MGAVLFDDFFALRLGNVFCCGGFSLIPLVEVAEITGQEARIISGRLGPVCKRMLTNWTTKHKTATPEA